MRSQEFITEDTSTLAKTLSTMILRDSDRNQLINAVEQIKLQCKPFLNEIEDPFSLYRGLRPKAEWAVQETAHLANRKPMSTPQWLHDELNKLFVRQFNVPYRNSVFCTGDVDQAKVYGMLFCIFPIGNYKYAWSPEYRDLYQNFDEFRSEHDQHQFTDTLNMSSYKQDGLNDAINSGHEIMMYTDRYYGLNMNHIRLDRNSGPIQNAIQDYLIS